jgi:hypothetical protein
MLVVHVIRGQRIEAADESGGDQVDAEDDNGDYQCSVNANESPARAITRVIARSVRLR